MALKPKEIRAMGPQDRAKALTEARAELMHERGLAAMGGAVKNPGRIRDLRTTIARILTILRQERAGALPARPRARAPGPRTPKAGARPAAKPAAKVPKAKPRAGRVEAGEGGAP